MSKQHVQISQICVPGWQISQCDNGFNYSVGLERDISMSQEKKGVFFFFFFFFLNKIALYTERPQTPKGLFRTSRITHYGQPHWSSQRTRLVT